MVGMAWSSRKGGRGNLNLSLKSLALSEVTFAKDTEHSCR